MIKLKVNKINNDLFAEIYLGCCREHIKINGYYDHNYIDNPHTQTCKCGNEIVYIFRKDLTCDIFE